MNNILLSLPLGWLTRFNNRATIKAQVKSPHTADEYLLEQQELHLFFDPGPLIYDLPSVCTAYTVEKMTLFKNNGTAIPIRNRELPKARIAGTLYTLNEKQIVWLDKQRENGVKFERKKVPVIVPFQDEDGELSRLPRPIWMYQAKSDYWMDRIEFDAVQHRRECFREFALADQVSDNRSALHNHFAYSTVRVEDQNMPAIRAVCANDTVIEYCRVKNEQELKRNCG